MLSFSAQVKNELCEIESQKKCCNFSQCYGMLLFGRRFNQREISFVTEHGPTAKTYGNLVLQICGVKVKKRKSSSGKYHLSIEKKTDREKVLSTFGKASTDLALRIRLDVLSENKANAECCRNAFVRGVFLVCGTVTDPDKDYHLEFSVQHLNLCKDLNDFLWDLNLKPKETIRKGQRVSYYKESESIEDLLTLMGAPIASLHLMRIKVYKSVRNNVNRKTNFETANILRTASAAVPLLESIRILKKSGKYDLLSEELKELADLRYENPDMSLRELGENLAVPISRSGVNHRLKRLTKLADDVQSEGELL